MTDAPIKEPAGDSWSYRWIAWFKNVAVALTSQDTRLAAIEARLAAIEARLGP